MNALNLFASAFPELAEAAQRVLTADELQRVADEYQQEQIETAQSEAAQEAARMEFKA